MRTSSLESLATNKQPCRTPGDATVVAGHATTNNATLTIVAASLGTLPPQGRSIVRASRSRLFGMSPPGPPTTALREMPPELKDGIRRWLQERREEYLGREREAAERRMLAFMPPVGPEGNGDVAR